jgi:hypothetical protein
MSSVKPGDTVVLQFVTTDQNQSVATPTGTPVGTLVQNGVDDGAVTVTVVPVTSSEFAATFTVPATYVFGDQVQLKVAYTATRVAQDYLWERTLTQLPGTAAGVGADQVTITITDPDTLFPVADADVWISSDLAGLNVIAGTLQSDGAGKVLFLLDAGVTYYLWMQKEGQKDIRGEEFVAVAD